MKPWKRAMIAAAACAVAAAALLAPRWINRESFRVRSLAALSDAVGGTVECARIDVRLVPRPRVAFLGVRGTRPGQWSGAARSIVVYPAVAPLFRGRVVAAKVVAEGPDVSVALSAFGTKPGEAPLTLAEARETTVRLLAALSARAPGLVVEVERGRLALFRGESAAFLFQDVSGRAGMPPGALRVVVRCASATFGRISLDAVLDARTLDGRAGIAVRELDAAAASTAFPPVAGIAVLRAKIDADAVLETEGFRELRAGFGASAPDIVLSRAGRPFAADAFRARGTLELGPGRAAVALSEFGAGPGGVRAQGTLLVDRAAQRATLSLSGAIADVAALRRALLPFAADVAAIRHALSYVAGGRFDAITVSARGRDPSDLVAAENVAVGARLRDGAVRVAAVDLDFRDVAGDVAIGRGILSAERLVARRGRSTIRGGSLSVGIAGAGNLFRAELPIEADLADIPPVLSRAVRNPWFRTELSRVDEVAGRAAGRLTLSGPTRSIGATIDASFFRLSARYGRDRLPVRIAGQRFLFRPDQIVLRGVSGSAGDATFRGLGLTVRRAPSPEVQAAFDGTLGAEAVRAAMAVLRVPSRFTPAGPIAVTAGRFRIAKDDAFSVSGSFAPKGGPAVAVDMRVGPGELDIGRLSVEDRDSTARAAVRIDRREVRVEFRGHIAAETLARLFPGEAALRGRIEGDFLARVARDRREGAAARGRLVLSGIEVPELMGPLSIRRLALEGAGNRVTVASSTLFWGRTPFSLKGSAEFLPGDVRVDMDAAADAIDWNVVRAAAPDDAAVPVSPGGTGPAAGLAVHGTVRLSAGSFSYGGLTWKPVRADIAIAPGAVDVSVKEADLCGVSTAGTVKVGPGGVTLDLRAASAGPDVNAVASCLRHERLRMTGHYELSAHITGSGEAGSLAGSLRGPVSFKASRGRIYKANLLAKILAILNVTQLFLGHLPDLAGEGFAYNKLEVRGELGGGKVAVNDAILDAASLNMVGRGSLDYAAGTMDFVVLASPLKTFDTIIRKIPIVGYILGGSLVSVPFRVAGNVDDPDTTILPASAVGEGILGVVRRTLKSPIKLIEPLLPKDVRKGIGD